jgi:hypothetical protein
VKTAREQVGKDRLSKLSLTEYFEIDLRRQTFNFNIGHSKTMDYFKFAVFLLIAIRVQGYKNNNTSNNVKEFKQNSIYFGLNSSHQWKYNQRKQFDDSFKHYRSDHIKTRQSRFISFNSKDDNIDVELDFAIPFISVPVKRTLDTGVGFLQGIIRVSKVFCEVK